MTGPSNPRGERAGTPGAGWETELRSLGEQYVPDGQPEPRANRAARRAAKRKARKLPTSSLTEPFDPPPKAITLTPTPQAVQQRTSQ